MKTIKINVSGFPKIFKLENWKIYDILKARYNVEISDNPDYLFVGNFDKYSFCSFKGIRIYFQWECMFANMNVVDYTINTVADFKLHDRMFYYPYYATIMDIEQISHKEKLSPDILKEKTGFCNYIYSHGGMKERTEIFHKISEYKKVDSAGRYLNNMGGFTPGRREDVMGAVNNFPKIDFQKKYKFTIAFENYKFPEYNTEKLAHAYMANTIPIYYGDPLVTKHYNPKSFINCMEYESFDEVKERVIYLDTHDDEYMEMLNEPAFVNEDQLDEFNAGLQSFLYSIFDQDYESAFRRPRFFWPEIENNALVEYTRKAKKRDSVKRIIKKLPGVNYIVNKRKDISK